jgi:hypothetical protein
MKASLNPLVLTFMERMMCDAIIMASYINGYDRPVFMDDHIRHCQRTFGVNFERWDGPAQEMFKEVAE